MPLEVATKYKDLKKKAEAVVSGRLDDMIEEEIAYNNILPQYDPYGKINPNVNSYNRELMVSRYFPPNYQVAVDTYVESMINNMPYIEFDTSKGPSSGTEATAINKIFRTTALADDFVVDMASVLRHGIRKGICVCELVPVSKKISGYIWQDGQQTEYTREHRGHFRLVRYNPETTLIDPNADPDRIQETAAYIIVEHGIYTQETFNRIAAENGWKNDPNEIKPGKYRDPRVAMVRRVEGFSSEADGIKVSKVFYADGMVEVIANDMYVISRKLNSKALRELPLIVYVSYAGGNTPYNRMLWCLMRQSIFGLAASLNLSLDANGKNINGPKFTTLPELANKDIRAYGKNRFIAVTQKMEGRSLKDEIYQPTYTDITQGSLFLQSQFQSDSQRISRLSALETGSQGAQQVRTDGIAQAMSTSSITKQSAFVRQAENTFFRTFARHWWWILLSRYDDFEELKGDPQEDGSYVGGISRELLQDIKAIRIKNGSTLPEDQMSNLQRIVSAMQMIIQTGSASGFDLTAMLEEAFEQMGISNADRFKYDPVQTLAKMLMTELGFTPEESMQAAQQFMQIMAKQRQAQPQGGQA